MARHRLDHVDAMRPVKQAGVIMDDFELTELERAHLGPTLVTLLSSKQMFYEQVGPLLDLGNLKAARH